MGMTPLPNREQFSAFLRTSISDSMKNGYSTWAITQPQALSLRLKHEPDVDAGNDIPKAVNIDGRSFFPGRK